MVELLDGVLQCFLRLGGKVAGRRDRVEHGRVRVEVVKQAALEAQDVLDLDVIQVALRAHPDRGNLILHRVGRGLGLLEELHEALAAGQLTAGRGIQVGGEHREGSHRAVLRERQLERTGDLLHGLGLSSTTNTRHRDAHVDGGTLVRVKQVGLQEDLTVGDRNDVRRDVRRHVVRLGLDDRQAGHRTAAELVRQLRTALEQAGVQVEDVAGVGFTARRAAQQQRDSTVGLGLLGQVIEHDEDVLALVHPVLADGRTRVGGHVLVAGGVRGRRGDDGRVFHGAGVLEGRAHGGNRRTLLADGDVDAAHLLVGVAALPVLSLVQDRVQGDGGLTGLAVANDELTLAAANGNHRVDGLQAGCQRLVDALTHHNAGGLELERAAPIQVRDIAEAVNRAAERVNRTAQVAIANRDGEDLARAVHELSFFDAAKVAEDDGTDFTPVEVHGQAQRPVLETQQLVRHGAGQALDVRDTIGRFDDVTHLFGGHVRRTVGLHKGVQCSADFLRGDAEVSHEDS